VSIRRLSFKVTLPRGWWIDSPAAEHVNDAESHLTAARQLSSSAPATHLCDLYFKALNKLWTAFSLWEGQPGRADTPSLIAMLAALPDQHELPRSREVIRLAALEPPILDHFVLNRRGWSPHNRDARIEHEASERHRKLKRSIANYQASGTGQDGVSKRLAEILYVVRSNLAHGEKMAYAKDPDRVQRDQDVSDAAAPVVDLIARLVLEV
jgi:hypothetical protein